MSSLLPESDLRQEFARRRTRQLLIVIPVLAAIFAMRSAGDSGEGMFGMPSSVVIAIGFAMVIGALVFTIYNWRCPACSKYLGRGINPSFCSKCGFKLKA